jgi:L-iditol 2-dehydrogenase
VELQRQSAEMVFSGELPVELLVSHRLPLANIRSAFELALHPNGQSLKIILEPQRWTE